MATFTESWSMWQIALLSKMAHMKSMRSKESMWGHVGERLIDCINRAPVTAHSQIGGKVDEVVCLMPFKMALGVVLAYNMKFGIDYLSQPNMTDIANRANQMLKLSDSFRVDRLILIEDELMKRSEANLGTR